MADFKDIPSVTELLKKEEVISLISQFGDSVVKAAIRNQLNLIRYTVKDGGKIIPIESLISEINKQGIKILSN